MSDCKSIKTIKDVNKMYNYKDEYPSGEHDSTIVSCGQDGKYNELKDKFSKHFPRLKNKESFVATIMCKCCKQLKPKGNERVSWKSFYLCLISKLDKDKNKASIDHLKTLK